MSQGLSAKQELLNNLLWAADAGKLDSPDCPSCHKQTVSVWYTHPRADIYREWYICSSCSFSLRMQLRGVPKHFTESRIDQKLQEYDADLLAKCKF